MSGDNFNNSFDDNRLFEDIIDSLKGDDEERSSVAVQSSDDDDDDISLDDEAPLDIESFRYIVTIMTVDVRNPKPDTERIEFFKGFIRETLRRFKRFFNASGNITRHSRVHCFLPPHEFNLPEETEKMCNTKRDWFSPNQSNYLEFRFGVNMEFHSVRQLLLFIAQLGVITCRNGFLIRIDGKGLPEKGVDFTRSVATRIILYDNGLEKFKEKNNANELHEIFVTFLDECSAFFGKSVDIVSQINEILEEDQTWMTMPGAMNFITYGTSTRQCKIYKNIEEKIQNASFSPENIKNGYYPAYLVCPIDADENDAERYSRHVQKLTNDFEYVNTYLADEVARRKTKVTKWILRQSSYNNGLFMGYLGMFDWENRPDSVESPVNDIYVYVCGLLEHSDFWKVISEILGGALDEKDINKLVTKFGGKPLTENLLNEDIIDTFDGNDLNSTEGASKVVSDDAPTRRYGEMPQFKWPNPDEFKHVIHLNGIQTDREDPDGAIKTIDYICSRTDSLLDATRCIEDFSEPKYIVRMLNSDDSRLAESPWTAFDFVEKWFHRNFILEFAYNSETMNARQALQLLLTIYNIVVKVRPEKFEFGDESMSFMSYTSKDGVWVQDPFSLGCRSMKFVKDMLDGSYVDRDRGNSFSRQYVFEIVKFLPQICSVPEDEIVREFEAMTKKPMNIDLQLKAIKTYLSIRNSKKFKCPEAFKKCLENATFDGSVTYTGIPTFQIQVVESIRNSEVSRYESESNRFKKMQDLRKTLDQNPRKAEKIWFYTFNEGIDYLIVFYLGHYMTEQQDTLKIADHQAMLYIWGECYAEEMEKNLKKLLGNAFDEDAFDEMVTQICSSE